MAGILHGSARTTPGVRAELQASKETSGALAKRYGLSRTTVAKWRARTNTADAPMGPRAPASTMLTPVEEAMIVEFRRRTLLLVIVAGSVNTVLRSHDRRLRGRRLWSLP